MKKLCVELSLVAVLSGGFASAAHWLSIKPCPARATPRPRASRRRRRSSASARAFISGPMAEDRRPRAWRRTCARSSRDRNVCVRHRADETPAQQAGRHRRARRRPASSRPRTPRPSRRGAGRRAAARPRRGQRLPAPAAALLLGARQRVRRPPLVPGRAAHRMRSFNDLSDVSFAANYRRVYGHPGFGGLPTVGDGLFDRVDVDIDEGIIVAAPLLARLGKAHRVPVERRRHRVRRAQLRRQRRDGQLRRRR